MHRLNDRVSIVKLAVAVAAYFLISYSGNSSQAQQWLHPELVKPLPQYQYQGSINRYPLSRPAPAEKGMRTTGQESTSQQIQQPTQSFGQELAVNPLAATQKESAPSRNPELGLNRQSPNVDPNVDPNGSATSMTDQSPERALPRTNANRQLVNSNTNPNKADSRKRKAKQQTPRQPEIDYRIYRDVSTYPLDPRKPFNPCTQGPNCGCGHCKLVSQSKSGIYGRPHRVKEPGGYTCGKNCPNKRPQFSVFWPRPFSAKLDERFPDAVARRYQPCQPKKLVDVFDGLTNFRLIDYHRTDNGYCGPGSDPYGCLGESRVAGLGFRLPGESVNNRFTQSLEESPASIVR
jgi:hypothetical protein